MKVYKKTPPTDTSTAPSKSPIFPIRIPPALKKRIESCSKHLHTTVSAFIRDATMMRVEQIETKQRQEREEKARERPNTFRSIGQSVLAPAAPSTLRAIDETKRVEEPLPKDLYREHAKRIAETIDRPREMRLRIDEAVAAVKKQWPLTHPEENEIIERLEKLVTPLVHKVVKTAEKNEDDELLGRTLAGIKTYGYTPTTDDEPSEE